MLTNSGMSLNDTSFPTSNTNTQQKPDKSFKSIKSRLLCLKNQVAKATNDSPIKKNPQSINKLPQFSNPHLMHQPIFQVNTTNTIHPPRQINSDQMMMNSSTTQNQFNSQKREINQVGRFHFEPINKAVSEKTLEIRPTTYSVNTAKNINQNVPNMSSDNNFYRNLSRGSLDGRTNTSFPEIQLFRAQKQVKQLNIELDKRSQQQHDLKIELGNSIKQAQFLKLQIQRIHKVNSSQKERSQFLSKMLIESRTKLKDLEDQIIVLQQELSSERARNRQIYSQKMSLEDKIEQFKQVEQYLMQIEQTQHDRKNQIKNNIAYEMKILALENSNQVQLNLSAGDLKQAQTIYIRAAEQIEEVQKQMNSKIKQMTGIKNSLEKELADIRQCTEQIKKKMAKEYRLKIEKLQNEMIELKEQNLVLREQSEQKVKVIKLEGEVKLVEEKNKEFLKRINELEEKVTKMKKQAQIREEEAQKSNKIPDIFDSTGQANFNSIIINYEQRNEDLLKRIALHEQQEQILKSKLEGSIQQCCQLKNNLNLKTRQEKSVIENLKNKIENLELQLKNERESGVRKIQGLQEGLGRKKKEIKEKDQFITRHLLTKVNKGDDIDKVLKEIQQYFTQ